MADPRYSAHLSGAEQDPVEDIIPIEDGLYEAENNEDLRAIIASEIDDSQTFIDYDISETRAKATEYYKGDPFGDEEEGRSQVVSRDVHDVVQGILPSLMRMFFGPEKVVEFVPQGPEDVEQADQATDYVNFIVQRDNPGFQVFWDAFKDALVRKVGIIKYWWDTSVEVTTSEYTGIDETGLQQILEDLQKSIEAEVTSIEQDENDGSISATITMKRYTDRVRIMSLPPEEFLIDRQARSIDDARFVAHRCIKTVSDLIAMGYNREDVEGASGDTFEDLSFNRERIARQPSDFTTPLDASEDPMQRYVLYHECYVRADIDEDGISELRKVCVVGSDYKILHDEQVDERPFASFCPDPEPHTFFGDCPGEKAMDIQRIKSGVLRATLDSLAGSVFPRTVVKTSGVNISDVMNTEVGAIIRADDVNDVKTLVMPFVGDKSFPMLEYMDRVRESRTGMSRVSQGLNAEALVSTTATAANQQFQAAQEHIELIARIFAETGMKRLFRGILRLLAKNQRQQRMVSLRNQWVPVDPRNWKADMDVTANVALGGGSNQEKMKFLAIMAKKQEGILQIAGPNNPLCGLAEYYETLSSMTELAGFKNVNAFWKDPAKAEEEAQGQPPQEPPPDPAMEKLKVEAQAKQAQMQIDAQSRQAEMQMKREMMQQELVLKREQLAAEMGLKREQLQAEIQLKREMGAMERERMSANISNVNMGGVPG